jgi:hypothetical protein
MRMNESCHDKLRFFERKSDKFVRGGLELSVHKQITSHLKMRNKCMKACSETGKKMERLEDWRDTAGTLPVEMESRHMRFPNALTWRTSWKMILLPKYFTSDANAQSCRCIYV